MGMTTTSTLLVQDGTALWERLLYNELHKGYGRWLDSLFKLSVKKYLNGKQKHFKVIIASTPLYIISLYFCCHVIQCLRHVTISLLLGSLIFCMCGCVHGSTCVSVLGMHSTATCSYWIRLTLSVLFQQIHLHRFSGSSYHIDMLKCELFHTVFHYSSL